MTTATKTLWKIDPTHSEVQFKVKHLVISTVTELVETAGFNPIIAGDLSVSGTLERMQLLLMQLTIKNDYQCT